MASPFHHGEQQIQERYGVRDRMEAFARRVVRPEMPDQHREFYSILPFIVLAARDFEGKTWTTLVSGPPGFVSSPEPHTLLIRSFVSSGDALALAFHKGVDVGVLGIELHTQRRNRINGTVLEMNDQGIAIHVSQAFGNCPQYINVRRVSWALPTLDIYVTRELNNGSPAVERYSGHALLNDEARAIITSADTFFISSGYRGEGENAAFGLDASHRGGPPGFCTVSDGGNVISFPDYSGNNHFNTLGNLAMDSRAGLVFIDFRNGSLLQITGVAKVSWGSPRLVFFHAHEVVLQRGALSSLRFVNPDQGMALKVVQKTTESDDVTSLYLKLADQESGEGGVGSEPFALPRHASELPPFTAGSYLPISIESSSGATLKRHYSLSNGPGAGLYRISVKRENHGEASSLLHRFDVGDIIHARVPTGEFALDSDSSQPTVLIAAGIGITPLLSMTHALASKGFQAKVTIILGARDGAHAAFEEELEGLTCCAPNAHLHVALSRPQPGDLEVSTCRRAGRIDGAMVNELAPNNESEFYICGPTGFMGDIAAALTKRGVPADRIHMESFGSTGH